MSSRSCRLTALIVAGIACVISLRAQGPEQFTEEQMKEFLLDAKVVASRHTSNGELR